MGGMSLFGHSFVDYVYHDSQESMFGYIDTQESMFGYIDTEISFHFPEFRVSYVITMMYVKGYTVAHAYMHAPKRFCSHATRVVCDLFGHGLQRDQKGPNYNIFSATVNGRE